MALDARPMRADARRNRDRIVAAAEEVYARYGDQAQVDEVARVAGVGVGTVYRHFPTKDALSAELVTRKFTKIAANVERWLARDDVDGWEAFKGMVTESCESMAADVSEQKMMWTLDPAAIELASEAREHLNEVAAQLIARAKETGGMRADFEQTHMPFLMCGLGNMIAMQVPGAPPDAWRKVLEVVFDGLVATR